MARDQLKIAGVYANCPYHEEGAAVIHELLTKESIPYTTYSDLVSLEIGDKLLESNVFAHHINSDEITFQSTLIRRFCEEEPALWKDENAKDSN